MKVTINAESKKVLTIAELDAAKEIVRQMKEDESSAAEYATCAVNATGDYCVKVYEVTAYIMKNCRVWDAYEAGSGTLDVWIDCTARTTNGFKVIGAYLTDIWNISGEDNQTQHMFIQSFSED